MYHRQLFASGETIREQKDEIARLHAVNDRLRAEIERWRAKAFNPVTLTDEELAAVRWYAGIEGAVRPAGARTTLRGLLERTETVEQ